MKLILPVFAGVLLGTFVSLEFAVWDRWNPWQDSIANEVTQPTAPEFLDKSFQPTQQSTAPSAAPVLTAQEDLRGKLIPAPTIDLTESANNTPEGTASSWSIWSGFRSRRSAQGFADHLAEFSNHDRALFAAQPAGIGRWDVVYHYTNSQQKSALQQALMPLLGQAANPSAGPQ